MVGCSVIATFEKDPLFTGLVASLLELGRSAFLVGVP